MSTTYRVLEHSYTYVYIKVHCSPCMLSWHELGRLYFLNLEVYQCALSDAVST